MKKKVGFVSVILLSLPIISVPAAAEVSANAAVVSNYVFRGVTQTNDDPTVQGGLDYDSGVGFSLGVWGSGVDEGFEVDLYGAYKYNAANGFGFGAGFIQYEYTDNRFSDSITEIYLQGRYKILSLSYYDGMINDDFADTEYSYLNIAADFEYKNQGYGFFWGNTSYDGGSDFNDSGIYYKVNISGLELKASYTDNKATDDELFFISVGSSWNL